MIQYTFCEYADHYGRPTINITFDDLTDRLSADEVVEQIVGLLKQQYNPEGALIHPFTEQAVLLQFSGFSKHDPMNHQYQIVETLRAVAKRFEKLPAVISINTSANVPMLPMFASYLGAFDDYTSQFWLDGGRVMHFAINLQTFILTGNTDLVRTDIIRSYLCDVGHTRGAVHVCVEKEEAWNEVLAYTAILQAKLVVEHASGPLECMVPVWVYPTTNELADESVKRGFNTFWRND
jgi:hypothetical protein